MMPVCVRTCVRACIIIVLYCIVYLYSAQYLHILQDSKRYLTNYENKMATISHITSFMLNGGGGGGGGGILKSPNISLVNCPRGLE